MQHEHHALLFRLRAVENDRWIIRASSSGRSEVIDPHGRASEQGIKIGETGTVVLGYGHRQTQPLGSTAYLLGPMAALVMLGYASWWVWNRRREAMAEEGLEKREGADTTLPS